MREPINRNGTWWQEIRPGVWQRYDDEAGCWWPSKVAPPQPDLPAALTATPPPPSTRRARREQASTGRLDRLSRHLTRALERVPRRARVRGRHGALRVPLVRQPRFPRLHALWGNQALRDNVALSLSSFIFVAAAVVAGVVLSADPPPGRTSDASGPQASGSDPETLGRKAAFVQSADDVCGRAHEALHGLPQPNNTRQAERYARRAEGIVAAARDELAQLRPPAAIAEKWAKKAALFGESFLVFEEMMRSASDRDPEALRRAQARIQRLAERFNRWASDYGFEVCSREV